MRITWSVVATLALAVHAAALAQPAAPGDASAAVADGRTGGETPAPGMDPAENSINPSGNKDVPVPVPAQPAPPAHPAQALAMEDAKQRLSGAGFQDVEGLYLDVTGTWRAVATKDGRRVMASVDGKGAVQSRPL